MNYGGYGSSVIVWNRWQGKFLFFPKKIEGKWYWLRQVYYRERMTYGSTNKKQWAVDIFDLIDKNNNA